MLTAVFMRELLLALRRPADALAALLFFVLVCSLFPLAIGPDAALLRVIGPGVVWVSALLAVLISLQRLFEPELADGGLEQWLLSPHPLTALVAAKVAAHWCVACLPLVLAAPLLALQYGLGGDAVGPALTLGVRGHVLLALVMLPMSVPPLVFGCAAVSAGQQGLPAGASLSLLGACLALAAFLCPWASAAALRLALE